MIEAHIHISSSCPRVHDGFGLRNSRRIQVGSEATFSLERCGEASLGFGW